MTVLIAVVVVLGIITIAQLIRVLELTSLLKGDNDHEITDKENKNQARLLFLFLFVFFGFFIWQWVEFGDYLLPESASAHGEKIDNLLNFNFAIIITAFAITHIILFYFTLRYQRRKGQKVDFLTHNNKLELAWTVIPAIVLAVIIIYGLTTWNDIMREEPEDPVVIELYAKQFDWTARYAGEDGKLGESNYRLISGTNPLGLVTDKTIAEKLSELNDEKSKLEAKLAAAVPGGKIAEDLKEEIRKVEKHFDKVEAYQMESKEKEGSFTAGYDDKPVKVEFHIPVDRPVKFLIRAQDVIHSAYMPHFRAQMNAVPGMLTSFYYTPTKTTDEMRQITGNPDFNYLLYCNKICGSAHYNMKMNIVVEPEEEYEEWLAQQKVFYAEGVAGNSKNKQEQEDILASK